MLVILLIKKFLTETKSSKVLSQKHSFWLAIMIVKSLIQVAEYQLDSECFKCSLTIILTTELKIRPYTESDDDGVQRTAKSGKFHN